MMGLSRRQSIDGNMREKPPSALILGDGWQKDYAAIGTLTFSTF
jgi:hypothetical protein